MKESRIQKTRSNIIWLSLYQIIAFSCNLILPRLIISTYGSTYNGIVQSITQFLTFVSILRLGVAGATRVSLYPTLAQNDVLGTSRIIKATENYMRRIGLIIVGYIAILAVVYPMIVENDFSFLEVGVLVVAIGAGTFAQYFFGITFQTLLIADQRLYIYYILQAISVVANTAISVLLITMGCTIQQVKIGSAVIFFIAPVILNVYCKKRYHIISKCDPDTKALQKKKDVLGHSIANIVHENTDIIVLSLFCNVSVVSVYSVYNLVMSGLRQVLNIFTAGAESVFGNMWAKGESDSLRRNLSYFEYMISVFVSIVFSSTLVLILPFVSNYTREVHDETYILPVYALIITVAQAFLCFRAPYMSLVQAAGFYKETKRGAYIEALLNICISVVLVFFIGITGTAVGTLFANAFRTFQYAKFASDNLVKRNFGSVIQRTMWTAANIVFSTLIIHVIIGNVAYSNWNQWIISALICIVVSTAVTMAFSLLFYRDDFKGLLNILKRMLRRKAA